MKKTATLMTRNIEDDRAPGEKVNLETENDESYS